MQSNWADFQLSVSSGFFCTKMAKFVSTVFVHLAIVLLVGISKANGLSSVEFGM